MAMATISIVGCGGNEKPLTDTTIQENESTDDLLIGITDHPAYLPEKVMSEEETDKLSVGTKILADDIEAVPDELALEKRNLDIQYDYITIYDGEEYIMNSGTPWDMDASGREVVVAGGKDSDNIFVGIEIVEITNFKKNEKTGNWEKYITIDDMEYYSGDVLSKEKIAELNGN